MHGSLSITSGGSGWHPERAPPIYHPHASRLTLDLLAPRPSGIAVSFEVISDMAAALRGPMNGKQNLKR